MILKKYIVGLTAAFLLVLPASGIAGIITFDDIANPAPPAWAPLPAGYAGFTWSGFWYVLAAGGTYPIPGAGIYSPPNAVSNGYGIHDSVMSSATPFSFGGAYITQWDPLPSLGGPATSITVEGLLGGVTKFSNTYSLYSDSYTHVAGYGGMVDTVHFRTNTTSNYNWWVMDNISVPEPSLVFLFGIGLAAVSLIANRFRA